MKVLLFLLLFNPLWAMDLPFEQKDLKLVGKALLEYSIFGFDVYEISYFTSSNGQNAVLVLDYKRDLKKEYSIKGWEVGFKKISKEKSIIKSQ